MIRFTHKGNFSKTSKYFNNLKQASQLKILDKYGRRGVSALASATPTDTGNTASSWYYEIVRKPGSVSILFNNSNIQNGVPIAVIIQLGHGTGTGGWVEGRDYINPAIQPIFDEIVNNAWKEVTSL